jgi:uncharacterized SAM-binding protein YcdF (DUF218 family)
VNSVAEDLHPDILAASRVLWDYLKLDQPLVKSDCLIAMGSHDLRVAEHAARLALDGWAPLLVCSGGLGRLTRGEWEEPEARKFARVALQAGLDAERVLVEERSSNTGENIVFSKALLKEKGIAIQSAILVHKPYMERRAYATARNYWSEVFFTTTSPPIPFESYATAQIPLRMTIEIMAGDFQRVGAYARKGFQIPQPIPPEAQAAFEVLIRAGFTRFSDVE